MSHFGKHQKYEFKYLKHQIGGNSEDIVEFIEKINADATENELLNILNNQTYCDKILGSGLYGYVYTPKVGGTMQVTTSSNKKINMNIVIKKANEEGNFYVKNIDDKIYIYGNLNITLEAIILSYINKLWHKKSSPHLPFMIGYSSCGSKNNMFVDKSLQKDMVY